jgi:undecaprenyl-diphosphatase
MEQTILWHVNRAWTSPAWDRVMATASSWDLWWPILVIIGLLVLWRGGFHGRAMLVSLGLTILVVDGIFVNSTKKLVQRPRPHAAMEGVRQVDLAKARPRLLAIHLPLQEKISKAPGLHPRGGSFPSGHTANNFAMATVVFLFYRRWGWVIYLPAALVSYSRLYVGAHWPTDVVTTAFLAVGLSLWTVALLAWLWHRLAPRFVPTLAARHPQLLPAFG